LALAFGSEDPELVRMSALGKGPSLDELLAKESEAMESLSQSIIQDRDDVVLMFIRLSIARTAVRRELNELRKAFPNRFTGEWDFNQITYLPPA
jgi:hypothetical protein